MIFMVKTGLLVAKTEQRVRTVTRSNAVFFPAVIKCI
jgi:hypothetical protein